MTDDEKTTAELDTRAVEAAVRLTEHLQRVPRPDPAPRRRPQDLGRCPVCAPLRDAGRQCACPPRASRDEPVHRDVIVRRCSGSYDLDDGRSGSYTQYMIACDCGERWTVTVESLR